MVDLRIHVATATDEGYPIELTLDRDQVVDAGNLDPTFPRTWVSSGSSQQDGERLFAWLRGNARFHSIWTQLQESHLHSHIHLHVQAAASEIRSLPWNSLEPAIRHSYPDFADVTVSVTNPDRSSSVVRQVINYVTNINTEGGAYVGGSVSAGGNFVGRDATTENGDGGRSSLALHIWRSRRLRLVGTLLLFTLTVQWGIPQLASALVPLCPPDQPCVIVSDIWPSNDEDAQRLTTEIRARVADALGRESGSAFALREGPAITSEIEAIELGAQERALLVVWGLISIDDDDRIQVHYHLTNLLGITESADVRPYRAQPLTYEPIAETVQCPTCVEFNSLDEALLRVGVIAHTTAGLVHYVQGRPEEATVDLAAALLCAGGGESDVLEQSLRDFSLQCKERAKTITGIEQIHYYLGKALILRGDYEQGIAQLQQGNTNDPATLIGIADAYKSWIGGHADEAKATLAKAAERATAQLNERGISPEIVYFHLGLIHELRGDYAEAQRNYSQARERLGAQNRDAYVATVALGRVYRLDGKLEESAEVLQQALDLVPSSPWAYLELALTREEQNQPAVADNLLAEAGQQAPNQAYVDIVRGRICHDRESYACAIEAYEIALTKRPGSTWVHGRLGDLYLPSNPPRHDQQSWKAARTHYRVAAEERVGDPWAQERLAYVLFNLQDYREAARFYQRAIDYAYSEQAAAPFYCSLALTYERQGDEASAAEANRYCDS